VFAVRDLIVTVIILGAMPVCFVSPYFGILMWYWVTYFNPHRFTWGYAYNLPVAMLIALPTLVGTLFVKKTMRALLAVESVLLVALWGWFTLTYIHAQSIPLFAENMAGAQVEMSHISKILFMTLVMVVVINSRERVRNVILVTAGSIGLLGLKTAVFGFRTGGESRVFGPPDSFLRENNAYGLVLNMALPLLFFLVRDEPRRWVRILLRVLFAACVVSILLTYSRGGLAGLAVVITAITLRSRHKIIGAFLLLVTVLLVISLAPPAWMDRMGNFVAGNMDSSGDMRLVSWTVAWRLVQDYPMGGSFDAVPNEDVYRRYQPRPLPNNITSSGPHSIYFQLLGDQGYVGLAIFMLLMTSCFWTLLRVRHIARGIPSGGWLVNFSLMLEVSLLAFMITGAFLGVVYLDAIYEMIGLTIILKMLCNKERREAHASEYQEEGASLTPMPEEIPAST
jgi:putative inorganic carbon (HCO3(-)) transporter